MAKHAWTIICGKAVVDETNNLSLHDLIDEVRLAGVPASDTAGPGFAVTLDWTLVTLWRRSDDSRPETITQRVNFRGPGDIQVGPFEIEIRLDPAKRVRAMANIQVLAFKDSGVYEFVVSHRETPDGEWREDAVVPVDVVITAEP